MKFKSYFAKALSVIFIFQFIVFILFSVSKKDYSFIYWAVFLVLPLGILIILSYLKVKLDEEGIQYKMPPFVNKKIAWNEIENLEIKNISPLRDFLGWGYRYSSKFGWSYILETNYAITITKKDGKNLPYR